jgi:cysteine desulfurase
MPKHKYCFDYAATTPLDPKVLSSMLPYFSKEFGNPSNLYELGRNANRAISKASQTISSIIGCLPGEFMYTASATEADNLAIFGTARANRDKGNRIIVSQIEHKGILAACKALEKPVRHDGESGGEGFEIIELPVGKDGLVNLSVLEKALTPQTILVSITSADSETGTIQPIAEISKIIKEMREKNNSALPYFHTDASQAAGFLDINVKKLGVDLITLSSHKIYGPKGIGGLYIKRGTKIDPIIYGGGQQGAVRSGTENVPGIVGFAEALKLNRKLKKTESARIRKMRNALEKGIFKSVPKVILNGHLTRRLPNFLNISILDIEGEALLLLLDKLGIMVNTGSACNSQSLEPSYILTAIGRPYEHVHGSIRFTLGKGNTIQDVKYVLKHLPIAVKKLRSISPLELKINQNATISDPRAFIGGQTPHFIKKNAKKIK